MADRWSRVAQVMGVARAELIDRLRNWGPDDWAAEEARLEGPASSLPDKLEALAQFATEDAERCAARGDMIGASYARGLAHGYANAALFARQEEGQW